MRLEVSGLHAGYGKVTVLHGVDISVESGEVVVVLGPNGAGKSTLLRALAGHLPLTGGSVRLGGDLVGGSNAYRLARRGVGYVPQEGNVFADLSVAQNLAVGTLHLGREGQERIEAARGRFPVLTDRSAQRAHTLSGGERQILAIASALVAGARLLLLDEPTAGLAPRFVDQIVGWIAEVAGDGAAVLWVVEQDAAPILAISTRTYVMEGGQVARAMASSELLQPGRLEEALLVEPERERNET